MDTDVAEALSIKTADALEIEAGGAANVKAGGVLGLDGSQIREQVNASSGAVGGSVVSDGEDSLEERIEQLTEQLAALKEQHDAVQEAGNAERTRLETLAREIRGDPLETA
jgi:seryl-tRNA synthetase